MKSIFRVVLAVGFTVLSGGVFALEGLSDYKLGTDDPQEIKKIVHNRASLMKALYDGYITADPSLKDHRLFAIPLRTIVVGGHRMYENEHAEELSAGVRKVATSIELMVKGSLKDATESAYNNGEVGKGAMKIMSMFVSGQDIRWDTRIEGLRTVDSIPSKDGTKRLVVFAVNNKNFDVAARKALESAKSTFESMNPNEYKEVKSSFARAQMQVLDPKKHQEIMESEAKLGASISQ